MSSSFTINDNISSNQQEESPDNSLQNIYADCFSTRDGRDEIRQALINTSDKAYEAESLSYLPNVSVDNDIEESDELSNDIDRLNFDEQSDPSLAQSSVFESVKYRALSAEESLAYDIVSKQESAVNKTNS